MRNKIKLEIYRKENIPERELPDYFPINIGTLRKMGANILGSDDEILYLDNENYKKLMNYQYKFPEEIDNTIPYEEIHKKKRTR